MLRRIYLAFFRSFVVGRDWRFVSLQYHCFSLLMTRKVVKATVECFISSFLLKDLVWFP